MLSWRFGAKLCERLRSNASAVWADPVYASRPFKHAQKSAQCPSTAGWRMYRWYLNSFLTLTSYLFSSDDSPLAVRAIIPTEKFSLALLGPKIWGFFLSPSSPWFSHLYDHNKAIFMSSFLAIETGRYAKSNGRLSLKANPNILVRYPSRLSCDFPFFFLACSIINGRFWPVKSVINDPEPVTGVWKHGSHRRRIVVGDNFVKTSWWCFFGVEVRKPAFSPVETGKPGIRQISRNQFFTRPLFAEARRRWSHNSFPATEKPTTDDEDFNDFCSTIVSKRAREVFFRAF